MFYSKVMIGYLFLPYLYTETEQQRNPVLRRQPVAIYQRNRIVALSPLAEQIGLEIRMTVSQAHMISSAIVLQPYDADQYQKVHQQALEVCTAFSAVIEPIGLIDIFLETGSISHSKPILAELPMVVTELTGLSCHFGIAATKVVARIAVMERKGLVSEGDEKDFLAPLPLGCLWTLPADIIHELEILGINRIGLLQQMPLNFLMERFGKLGLRMKQFSLGIDNTPVKALYPPQHLRARHSFFEGVISGIDAALQKMSVRLALRLRQQGVSCRRIDLRVGVENGKSFSEFAELPVPNRTEEEILLTVQRLFEKLRIPEPITSLQIEATELDRHTDRQLNLEHCHHTRSQAQQRLQDLLFLLRQRFGQQSVKRATEIDIARRERILKQFSDGS